MTFGFPTNFRFGSRIGFPAGGASVPFSPADVSGLVVWLAADEIVGLNDGDPVATWSDLSGSGNDATEATNQPTYQTNEINGLPVVRFDGTNDKLAITDNATIDITTCTIFVVAKVTGVGVQGCFLVNKNYDGSTLPYSLAVRGDAVNTAGMASFSAGWHSSGITTDVRSDGLFHIFAGSHDGATLKYFIDGVLDDSAAWAANFPSNNQPLYIATYFNDAEFTNGDFAEILVYNSAISGGDFASVQNYLADKYAL